MKKRFKIIYKNEDYIVNELSYELNDHIYVNRMFETNGVLSPGGKRKCIYQWLTSMIQYFTIRTMDYSKPDLKLSAMSSGLSWINDDYILYIHMIYGIPYIVRADEANKGQHINVLYETGHIKEVYPVTMSASDMDFKIKDVKDGVILLEDRKNQREYEINYDFDNNGLIRLFGDQTEIPDIETWIGTYTFSEYAPPNQNMFYTIHIYKEDENFYATINIDGFQTITRIQAKVTGDKSSIRLELHDYLPDNQYELCSKGDTLLSFKRENSEMYTYWEKFSQCLKAIMSQAVYTSRLRALVRRSRKPRRTGENICPLSCYKKSRRLMAMTAIPAMTP